jgi:hypothetical protein
LDEVTTRRAWNRPGGKPQAAFRQAGISAGRRAKKQGSRKADREAAIRRQAHKQRQVTGRWASRQADR